MKVLQKIKQGVKVIFQFYPRSTKVNGDGSVSTMRELSILSKINYYLLHRNSRTTKVTFNSIQDQLWKALFHCLWRMSTLSILSKINARLSARNTASSMKLSILSKINWIQVLGRTLQTLPTFNSIQDQHVQVVYTDIYNENIFQFYPRSTLLSFLLHWDGETYFQFYPRSTRV